ncbi:MAG: hypothetical protein PHI59_09705, partial [Candidatus Omnitrophica bacterium]|nr:hypothetical protein [Candidatus Omnitrophota bacterium]
RFRFLFVDDAVQSIMLSLFSKTAAPYRCYNVAGEEIITLKELAQQIFEIAGNPGRVVYNKDAGIRNRVLNIDRIKKELKFEPKTLKENLKLMVSGIKNEKACAFGRARHE